MSDGGRAPTDDLRARAVRGTAWSALQTWGGRMLSLVVFATLGRLLEPDAFGLLAIAVVFVELGKKLVEGAFSRSIVQFPEIEDADLDTALWTALAMGVGLAGALVVAAPFLSGAFGEPRLTLVLQLLAASIVIGSVVSVPVAIMQRELRFGAIAARRLLAASVGGGVAIALAVAGAGVYALVAQVLVGAAVSFVVVWTAVDWRPGFTVSRAHLRPLVSFGASVVGFEMLLFAQHRADDLLIATFLGSTALGFYFIAYRILHIMVELLGTTVGHVAFPTFSRLAHDRPRLLRAFLTSTRLTALAIFPVFAGMAVVAEDAIVAVFGAQWRPSAPAMQWMALDGIAIGLGAFYSHILMAIGRPGVAFRLILVRVTTLVAAFAVGVQFGFVAVAAALAIHGVLFVPVNLAVLRRTVDLPVRRYLRQLVEPLVAAGVMAGAVWWWQSLVADAGIIARLVTSVVLGAAVYAGILAITARSLLREPLEYLRLLRPRSTPHTPPDGASGGPSDRPDRSPDAWTGPVAAGHPEPAREPAQP